MIKAFAALGEIIVGAKQKRDAEYQEFLVFYRELVETLPTEACNRFGTLNGVEAVVDGNESAYGIQMNVADFLYWKNKIDNTDIRFVASIREIKSAMLDRLTNIAEVHNLEPAARKALLAILIDAKEGN